MGEDHGNLHELMRIGRRSRAPGSGIRSLPLRAIFLEFDMVTPFRIGFPVDFVSCASPAGVSDALLADTTLLTPSRAMPGGGIVRVLNFASRRSRAVTGENLLANSSRIFLF